jgi:hypothetical protein
LEQKKSAQLCGAFCVLLENPNLLDLGFLEFNMLANHRIIFGERELFRLGARIFLCDIEEASVSG